MSNNTFVDSFLEDLRTVIERLDHDTIEAVASALAAVRERGGRLFFCGSGGGAGHASHAACDFRKLGAFEAYSVTDNVSELTARINDEGWETSYSAWLERSRLGDRDGLFVFSVGGGSLEPPVSVNLVKAIQTARDVGASVVGIAGRNGGFLKSVADACIVVPTGLPELTTPQAEGLQAVLWHLLVSHPSIAVGAAKWESIDVGSS